MTETRILYQPKSITAPGETLSDLLEEQGMTQTELAKRMGRPLKTINEIINGKAVITPDTALQLEKVFETPADYWIRHEAEYRAFLARRQEEQKYPQWYEWLDEMPLGDLKKCGKLPNLHNRGQNKNVLLRALLGFFGVASPEEWEKIYGRMAVAYRRNPQLSDPKAVAAWLRLGELQVAQLDCPPFDARQFEKALIHIRSLTCLPPEEFEPQLKQRCLEAGVMLVLVPSIPRARVSGAARWMNRRPVIQLSLYGKKNDRFWFTFFHEAGHILHDSQSQVFLDEWDGEAKSQEEREADAFAARMLIPPDNEGELPLLRSKESVREFAARIGIHPGIVVGRLQHDSLVKISWMNELKETLAWADEIDE